MLRLESVSASHGAIQALRNVSLHVSEGEIVALLGANGAGKTTLMKVISGIHPPAKGRLIFGGQNITGVPAEQILRLGIGQVPEGRQIFAPLSVLDNLLLGAYVRFKGKEKKEVWKDLEAIFGLFPVLKERKSQRAGTLSGGEQQMVAIGRTLMSRPKLLLLDEPSMGLAPKVVGDIFRAIRTLPEPGNHDPAGGAECQGRPADCRTGICHGNGADHPGRGDRGPVEQQRGPARLFGQRVSGDMGMRGEP